jgi:hypothetical protein
VKSIYGIGSEESDDGDPRGLWPNVTIPQFYGIEPFPGSSTWVEWWGWAISGWRK